MGYGFVRRQQYIDPEPFSYSGICHSTIREDGSWEIRFETSGTLILKSLSNVEGLLLCLIGGGGGGGGGGYRVSSKKGGSGYAGTPGDQQTVTVSLETYQEYEIVVGVGGEGGIVDNSASGWYDGLAGEPGTFSSAFGQKAEGGPGGKGYVFGHKYGSDCKAVPGPQPWNSPDYPSYGTSGAAGLGSYNSSGGSTKNPGKPGENGIVILKTA